MEKRPPGVTLYRDKTVIFESLTDDKVGEFVKALIQYAHHDTRPDFTDPTLCAIWGMFKACVDRDREEYKKKCESNSKAGKASAAKRKATANASEQLSTDVDECAHNQPTITETVTETVPVTVSITETETGKSVCEASMDRSPVHKTKHFIPPTVEEVQAYCSERKNHVDARRFVDYYTASGWKRGNTQITDWKAVLRSWENDDANRAAAQLLQQNARNCAETKKECALCEHESGFGYTWD